MLGIVLNERYRIDSPIGEGGMASVYMATDLVLRRDVAVKILHPHLAQDSDLCHRFQQEASIAARLEHHNIVKIFDYGQHIDGRSFIVSEVIRGQNLHKLQVNRLRAKKGPFEPYITAMICEEVLKGLQCAHSQSFIHRDVKPDNIMVSNNGHVKLTDFGIAKNLSSSLTMAGQFLGSPSYSSPEQVQGQRLDRRTDLFSLGIILYEGLTSRLPFTGKTAHEVMLKIAKCSYIDVSDIVPECPSALVSIVRRALKVEPAERFQNAEELMQEIRSYLDQLDVADSRSALEEYSARPGEFLRRVRLKVRSLQRISERAETERPPGGSGVQRSTSVLPQASARPLAASGVHEESLAGRLGRSTRNSRRSQAIQRMTQAREARAQANAPEALKDSQRIQLKSHPALQERRDRTMVGLQARTTQRRVLRKKHHAPRTDGVSVPRSHPIDRRRGAHLWRKPIRASGVSPRRSEFAVPIGFMAGGVIFIVLMFRLIVFVAENRTISASTTEGEHVQISKETGGSVAHIRSDPLEASISEPASLDDQSIRGSTTGAAAGAATGGRAGHVGVPKPSVTAPRLVPSTRVAPSSRQRPASAGLEERQVRVAPQLSKPSDASTLSQSSTMVRGRGSGAIKDLAILRLSTIPADAPISVNGVGKQAIRKLGQYLEFDVPAGRSTLTVGPIVAGGTKYMATKTDLYLQPGESKVLGVIRLVALRTLTLRIRGEGVIAKIDGDPYALRNGELQIERPEGRLELEIAAASGKVLRRMIQLKGDDFTLETSLE
jgi:serine/threonine protein kinase